MKPASARRQRQLRERRAAIKAKYGEQDVVMCEVGQAVNGECQGVAVDVHEPHTRARGGSISDPENMVAVCRSCHDWIHGNPFEATKLGLLSHGAGSGEG